MSANLVIGNGSWDSNFYNSYIKANLLSEFSRTELAINLRLHFRMAVHEVLSQMASLLDGKIIPTGPRDYLVHGPEAIACLHFTDVQNPFDSSPRIVDVEIRGTVERLKTFHETVQTFIHTKDVYINWWFKTGNDLKSIQLTLEDNKIFHPEYYPYIPDVDTYIQRFNKSEASILILLGEPGTGKTSFIRHLLRSAKSECMITYDDDVMRNDALYIEFLSNKRVRYLVLEDADLLLTERVKDNNKVMSKLLNTSDGLIPLNGKKLIFTANLHDSSKIDEALTRPGRCFGVLEFEAMSNAQAQVVAAKNGITLGSKPKYTLAEIFSLK